MILNRRVPEEERPTLLRPTPGVDSDGDPTESWDSPLVVELPRGSQIQDRTSVAEFGSGSSGGSAIKRLTTSERYLFVPGPNVVRPTDRVRVGGETWRIEGTPTVHRGSRPSRSHTTVKLSRSEGA